MIPRCFQNLDSYIRPGKVLVLYGPRRVGKTTLIQTYLQSVTKSYKLDSGDNIRTQEILGSQNTTEILQYAEDVDLLVIDEAQRIPGIGMGLKILVDHRPDICIIATGSSSFDLSRQTGEPLFGRKKTLVLYPVAQMELLKDHSLFYIQESLNDYLIYGGYPEVLLQRTQKEKREILHEMTVSSLLKDILALERLRTPPVLLKLLQLLAYKVGQEVSLNELSNALNKDIKTIDHYLYLLEQSFIIVRLGSYSKNLRKEISKKQKYYFFDNGIRNALIANFNTIDQRNDIGQLWENFLVTERIKKRAYNEIYANQYFWRTYDKKEVDYVEERDGSLFGFEFKWNPSSKSAPATWLKTYEGATYDIIHKENYIPFIT